ncbi:MAG: ATP-binding protein [Desulfuromonadaceae bacterium]|nr:ATP-binding protein [Desulfuromonadaceae bacterium]
MWNPFSGKFGFQSFFRRQRPAVITSKSALELSALPSIEQILEQSDSLPQGCAGYFLPRPLRDEALLVGREGELEDLEAAFSGWQNGQPASVVVVGTQGCGKTSFINCFLNRRSQDWNIRRCEIGRRLHREGEVLDFYNRLFGIDPAADTVDKVVEWLLQASPRIIVVEGIHNLLLRVIGGRKALESFMYIVLCTRKRHFWLHTCRLLPWVNMDRHAKISRFFSHIMNLELLSEDDLRKVLKLRLEKCGLGFFFYRSREEYEKQRQTGSDEQDEKESAFYRGILANSGSNFFSALYFILLCCRYEMKTQSLLLYPPDHLDLAFVKEMDKMHLLALAELAGHGVLSVAEHQRIFRTDLLQSRIVFEYLEQMKLVVADSNIDDGGEKVYDLSPIIHHSVKTALEQINLLY